MVRPVGGRMGEREKGRKGVRQAARVAMSLTIHRTQRVPGRWDFPNAIGLSDGYSRSMLPSAAIPLLNAADRVPSECGRSLRSSLQQRRAPSLPISGRERGERLPRAELVRSVPVSGKGFRTFSVSLVSEMPLCASRLVQPPCASIVRPGPRPTASNRRLPRIIR